MATKIFARNIPALLIWAPKFKIAQILADKYKPRVSVVVQKKRKSPASPKEARVVLIFL
jgi:hypothetical protein